MNSSLATTASFELDRVSAFDRLILNPALFPSSITRLQDEGDEVVDLRNGGGRDSGEEILNREMIANPEGVNSPESPSTSAQRMRVNHLCRDSCCPSLHPFPFLPIFLDHLVGLLQLRPRILRGGDSKTWSRRRSPRSNSNIAAVVVAAFSKNSHNEVIHCSRR